VYTHIHDNFGKTGEENEDLHLLPFEGLIDYQSIIDNKDTKFVEKLKGKYEQKSEQ
jgi:hypothetical protein